MNTTTRPTEKRTDDERLRHFYLGRDAEGDYHHWDRDTETATVITPDGERTYTDDVPEHELGTYRQYVRDRRGSWDEIVILPPGVGW